ncbi:MAG: Ig-like domain-containing protein [Acidobacteriota bacterium]
MRRLVLVLAMLAPAAAFAQRAQSRTVYLNRNGGTVLPGVTDSRTNHSSLVAAPIAIAPWSASPALWSDTVSCLQRTFAPFDVQITDVDPGALPHLEAIFGGSGALLGMPPGVYGVSPMSTTCDVVENSIVFAFTDVMPQDARTICEVTAQELGHSYGLDHELLAADPMTYLSYAGERSFQNALASCGETTPRPCGVQGYPSCGAQQNSYAVLLARLGVAGTGDIEPPQVAITAPADGATVAPSFVVTAAASDDQLVRRVALRIDGADAGTLTAPPWTFASSPDLAPGEHVVEVTASDGTNDTTVEIAVTVPGADDGSARASQPQEVGCSAGGDGALSLGLAPLLLVVRRRRGTPRRVHGQ